MPRLRQFIFFLQLVTAFVAVTSAAMGCDDCWHHFREMAAWSDSGSPQLEAPDQDASEAPHFCACSCSSLMSGSVYSPQPLLPLVDSLPALQSQLPPFSAIPPFLPPRA